jgi:hypothetical protein
LKTVMYVVWGLFILGAAWSVFHAGRTVRRREQRIANWPRVKALITGSRTGWTSGIGNATKSIRHFPIYQFSEPGGTVVVGESDVSLRNRPEPGERLEVAYDPADPHTSFPVSSHARFTLGCLTAFFAVFAVAALWFISVFPLL